MGQPIDAGVRVALVDDHRVVRHGLRTFLELYPDMEVVCEASYGEEALVAVERWSPDVVIMDLLMPGGMDGVEAICRLRGLTPHTQVVALTSSIEDARMVAALRAGAIGYVRKDAEPDVLLAAVRAAARGQSVLDPGVAGVLLREVARAGQAGAALTDREREVLRLIALGRTNREIADILVISAETVKTHVGNTLSKLHLAHRTQAALYAVKRGLISLDDLDLES